MSIPIGVQLERDQSLQDVSEIVNEYGEDIKLYIFDEVDLTRDKYNSVKKENITTPKTLLLKAFPIENNPNQRQMEKAGIKEQCESIAWLSMKDITDNGLTFDTLDVTRYRVSIDNNNYEIKEKNRAVHYADAHLYITLGLFKKR